MMLVLCLAALCAVIAGCQEKAASPKAKEVKATAEKAPPPKPPPPPPPPPKPAAAVAGPTLGPFNLAKNWAEEQGFVVN